MSPNTSSAKIVFLNLPPKTFIGLDLVSFNSSPQFQGITNIPYGVHFLYSGTDASLSIRQGRWLRFSERHKLQTLQWNIETESLDLIDQNNEPTQDVVSSMEQPRRGLVDYTALQDANNDLAAKQSKSDGSASDAQDGTERSSWPSLASRISPQLLTRILDTDWFITSISSSPLDAETIPGLSHLETTDVLHQHPLNLLPINLKQTWSASDIGRVRTDRARDRSWYLSSLIDSIVTSPETDKAAGAKHLLGELQFTFLMVLTLANYSCLEQWKRLLSVFLTCKSAIGDVPAYFAQVVKVLHEQMTHVEDVEGGLFELRDELGSAWLRSIWARFKGNVDEVFDDDDDKEDEDGDAALAGGKEVKKEIDRLQRFFEERYGWVSERDTLRRGMLELEDGERVEVSVAGVDEDEETGEYAPTIVET